VKVGVGEKKNVNSAEHGAGLSGGRKRDEKGKRSDL